MRQFSMDGARAFSYRSEIRIDDSATDVADYVSLTYYAPKTAQGTHEHDFNELSFLLCGSMSERCGSHEHELFGAGVGFKPGGQRHENRWGRYGALVFSVKMHRLDYNDTEIAFEPGWRNLHEGSLPSQLLQACLSGGAPECRGDAAVDLIALAFSPREPVGHKPPRWLLAARDAIFESPQIMTVARAAYLAGVHRVYFARAFQRCFGVAPSLYRRRCLAARAIACMMDERSTLVASAQQAGFADQSHMTRTIKALTGFPAGLLRTLLN